MKPQILRLSGDIAEIFEKDGHRVARILLKSGSIELSVDEPEESHLGDHVLIDLAITIQSVRHEVLDGASDSASEL